MRSLVLRTSALVFVAGCGGNETSDTTSDSAQEACDNRIVRQNPEDGADGVFYRTTVAYELLSEDNAAAITVEDAMGNEVPGTTTVDGTQVSWDGDDLEPLTTYTATLNYECGTPSATWTTSAAGGLVTVDLVDRVYAIDTRDGDWMSPAGIGELFSLSTGESEVLLSPISIDEGMGDLSFRVAPGDGTGSPLPCEPTTDFPPAQWDNPRFEMSGASLTLNVANSALTLEDVTIEGAFFPQGESLQGVAMEGLLDARGLEGTSLVPPGVDPCVVVATFGGDCEPCADGEAFCTPFEVSDLEGVLATSDGLDERTDDDILADEACIDEETP